MTLSATCANPGVATGALAAGGAGSPAVSGVGVQAGTAAVGGAGGLGLAPMSAGASAGFGTAGVASLVTAGATASSPSVGTTTAMPVAGFGAAASTAGVAASAGSPAVVAAAGSQAGQGTAGAVAGAAANGGATSPAAASFAAVWDDVIQAKGCTSSYCHGQGQGQGGLRMGSRVEAYKNLVGVMTAGSACGSSGKLRVKPSEPAASVLLDKLSHAMPSCGDSMPIGAKLAPNCVSMTPTVCTTEAEISLVRDWITAGAQDN